MWNMAGRNTQTLDPSRVPQTEEEAAVTFPDRTQSVFDPTTRRVSTRALRDLIAHHPNLGERSGAALDFLLDVRDGREAGSQDRGHLFGDFFVLGSIGKGGMAEVRLAIDLSSPTKRLCVLKLIAEERLGHEGTQEMFLEEARIYGLLEHRNIVSLYDHGEIDGTHFMALELIDGVSLRELQKLVAPVSLPPLAIVEIGAQVASALAYAHSATDPAGRELEVVHRDATPHNFLVSRAGRVKVVDFGIARFRGRDHQTRKGHVKGKLGYMSPEQCKIGPIDGRADVFSLGVVLAELVANQKVLPPTFAVLSNITEVVSRAMKSGPRPIPSDMHDLIISMTDASPDARPWADEVATACHRIAETISDGEGIAQFAKRTVFDFLEPFDEGIILDFAITDADPIVESSDPSADAKTEPPSYAGVVGRLRSRTDGGLPKTRRVVIEHSGSDDPTEFPLRTTLLPPTKPVGPADPTIMLDSDRHAPTVIGTTHASRVAIGFLVFSVLVAAAVAAFLVLR